MDLIEIEAVDFNVVEIFSAFVQEFRNWESAWALEAVYVVVYEIRVLAEKVCCAYLVQIILCYELILI